MPNFKPKTNKHILVCEKSILTVDKAHNDMLKKMDKRCEKIPKLKEEIKALKNRLKSLSEDIDEFLEVKDKIEALKQEIKIIRKEKKTYYLKNSKHLFDYFESKQNVKNDENKKTILHNFFKKSSVQEKTKSNVDLNKENENIKAYLLNINDSNINFDDYIEENISLCKKCNIGEMILVDYEGVCICNKCGARDVFLTEQEKPSYKEPPKEVCFYAYKRINHFREILAQFQAKESTQISDEVLNNIKRQIKKERIELKHLSNDKTKQILKNLGYNKYYEHIPFIKHKLGIKPPTMSVELENKLCNLFMEIQNPYAKFCPNERVNFLNYYYVLYKMCELLREDSYLKHFYMLKDPVKRMEQDEIWKKICGELNWEFIPTP